MFLSKFPRFHQSVAPENYKGTNTSVLLILQDMIIVILFGAKCKK